MESRKKRIDQLQVEVYENRDALGRAAATAIGEKIKEVIEKKGKARIVFASAPSQQEFLHYLKKIPDIDWKSVTAFHQDEWVGVSREERYSFGGFIKRELFDEVHPGQVEYIDSLADPQQECMRYGALLEQAPIDIICLGIGENGHIAFNEPHEADFHDPAVMKKITLDERCRNQEFHDFGFPSIEDVPRYGITITIPAILSCTHIFAMVPGERKAEAVMHALTGPVSEKCPASVLRRAPGAVLYLDKDSAAGVTELL